MTNANYTTSAAPQLMVSCHADLQIVGTPESSVRIEIADDSPASRIARKDELISITAMDNCDISCPIGTVLTIELVSGDLHITQVKGNLTINTVNGDAALYEVGATTVKTVQGDLSLRDIGGDVKIETVRGDAKLKRTTGQVIINKVSGDLAAHDIGSGLIAGNVNGDLAIETELRAGQAYTAKAAGDVVFRVDGGGAQFTLNCRGDLRVRIPMTNWAGDQRSATGTYGDGSAQVTLVANGDLLVLPGTTAGTQFDPDQISDQVESMIESALGQFEVQMSQIQRDMEKRFGSADRAAERAQRSAERAKRRAERAAGAWGFAAARTPAPPTPPTEPVSDQERLMILKMVEEGKISVDQAAQLLSALES